MSYHIAVDIGASSGRLLLAEKVDESLTVKEIHRFKNGFERIEGHDRWNIDELLKQICMGLEKALRHGVQECTLGIDTWAVDYVLLDGKKKLAQPIAYRDSRTKNAMEKFWKKIPKTDMYRKTGIQFLPFNTVFQYAVDDALNDATTSLLIPDYLAYALTGKMVAEETNASTTQLLNVFKRDYDDELIQAAGVTRAQLPALVAPGTYIGDVQSTIREQYTIPIVHVYAVATHDTASAVVGVPAQTENFAYISSGTWSLIGTELKEPVVTQESYEANYTNEWGAEKTYRFLKNITGMWTIQEIARNLNHQYTYAEMAELAAKVTPFQQIVDLNDDRFTNPENMIEEIQAYCREQQQPVPETVGELTMCVYSNLARLYAMELQRLEQLTDRHFEVLHIVGGGSNVALLNQLTADTTGIPVVAGPGEATAYGNLLMQLTAVGEWKNVAQARQYLRKHITLQTYKPKGKKALQ